MIQFLVRGKYQYWKKIYARALNDEQFSQECFEKGVCFQQIH